MTVLAVSGLNKTFVDGDVHVQACRDVALTIAPGEIVGLVGESGSGKSTLARVLLGLETADTGIVQFEGRDLESWLQDQQAYRAAVQAIFQQPSLALDHRRTIGWSIAEPLVIHGIGTPASRPARVDELLGMVGLEPALATRRPGELSGGQLQRVNIARSLSLQPRLLICDEPVSALDVSVQAQILNLFLDIQQRLGTAMLFVAHDLAVVHHIADRIAVMYAGRIVETGPAEQVCRSPAHPYTSALVAAVPETDTTLRRRDLAGPAGELPSHGCRFAPRCPRADSNCHDVAPDVVDLGESRETACWHPLLDDLQDPTSKWSC